MQLSWRHTICIYLLLLFRIFSVKTRQFQKPNDNNLYGRRKPRLSNFPKEPSFLSLRNARRTAKKVPAGIRELGRTYSPDANKFRRSFASEVERRGRKEDRRVAFWRVDLSSEGDPLRSIGTTRAARTLRTHKRTYTYVHTRNMSVGWMFMAQCEYSIQ